MKNWLRIFILCCACFLTATIFVSCGLAVNAQVENEESTTTPSIPITPVDPVDPNEPDEPTEPNNPSEPPVVETPCEHNYITTEIPATCTEDGLITYTCECGDSYKETIPAYGHEIVTIVTEPTCTTEGSIVQKCNRCDFEEVIETTPITKHPYTVVETPATCTESGSKTFTCECGHSYTEKTDDATGHDYDDATHQCKHCDAIQSPIENLANSYWYYSYNNQWAFYFKDDGTYISYKGSLNEEGKYILNEDTNGKKVTANYYGEYSKFTITDYNTQVTVYKIMFTDNYLKNLEFESIFTLTFQEVDGQYQLTGEFKNNEYPFIFGGYEVL